MPSYEGFADLETAGWSNDRISDGYVSMFAEASDMAVPAIVSAAGPPDAGCQVGNGASRLI